MEHGAWSIAVAFKLADLEGPLGVGVGLTWFLDIGP